MSEANDSQLDEFFEVRKPGAHLDEGVVADDFVLMLGVDLVNFPKFPKVDDTVTYPKADLDIRYEMRDSGPELDDYSGPYRQDLRYTDFSNEFLASKVIPWSDALPAAVRRRMVGRGREPVRRGRLRPRSSGPRGTTRSFPS